MLSYCESSPWEQTSESTDNHNNSRKFIWKCRLSIEQRVITALFKGPVCVSSIYTYHAYVIFYIHIMDSVHYFIWIFYALFPKIYWLDIHSIVHLIIYMVVYHIISYGFTYSGCYIGKCCFSMQLYVYIVHYLMLCFLYSFILKHANLRYIKWITSWIRTCITLSLSKNNLYCCFIKCDH